MEIDDGIMKNLKNIKTGITHAGKFHTDDVISTAFIQYFSPEMKIVRVNEYENQEDRDDEIVYDIGLGEFDHHQEERRVDDNGHPYCAFGLLWETYGREYLENNGFKNIEDAFELFKERYVFKIDEGDNEGYKNLRDFTENDLIMKCNPMWFEDADEGLEMSQFVKAVRMGKMFLENWTRSVYAEVEEHDYVF